MPKEQRKYNSVEYSLLPEADMEDYYTDENKFKQIPWEDQM